MNRIKPTRDVQADVMFLSDRECCVCNKRGDHIHHIDGDNSNSKLDNLAYLCFDCHSEATMTNTLRKKLSPEAILKFRELKYTTVQAKRKASLGHFNAPINQLTTEDLLNTTKNAIIIIEIEKLKEEFDNAEEKDKHTVLGKLFKFSDHNNFRITYDVFAFLELISEGTRFGMTNDLVITIESLIVRFFPHDKAEDKQTQINELADTVCEIALNIIYDAARYLKNYEVTMWGLNILKYIQMESKQSKYQNLAELVSKTYDEILCMYLGDNPDHFIELIKIFKADLNKGNMCFPILPDDLMTIVYSKGNNENEINHSTTKYI